MSIERMRSIWLFAPSGQAREVLDRLAAMGLAHVADCGLDDSDDHEALGVERVYPEAAALERRVQMLRESFAVLARFHKSKKSLLENFIPTPVEVREADVREALARINIEDLHTDIKARDQHYNALTQALQKARDNLKALSPLEGVKGTIPGTKNQRNVSAFLGVMTLANLKKLEADERSVDTYALAIAAERKRNVIVQAACPVEEADDLFALLREFGAALIDPEPETVTIDEYLAHRRDEIERIQGELDSVTDKLRAISAEFHHTLAMVLGYWEERLRIANAAGLLAESKRLTVLRAYVREADLEEFKRRMAVVLPDVAVDVRDPVRGEAVPVSLKNSRLFAPTQFLVSMFGLPNYFTFDPTPYIVTSFMVFFGFCFGDAVYGIMMIVFGSLLARKYRDYPGPRSLFSLLAVAGIPTFVVGAVTGTWASDLFSAKYLGEGNPLAILCDHRYRFDLIEKSLVALCIALVLGVVNQFLSLICLMVRNARQGDFKAAVFDGAFWLLVLPAVVAGAAGLFVSVPSAVNKVAFSAAGIGAVGLVLTQGRAEKSFIGKVAVGVISLYGIVGTYGVTAFIGDILSYSRLLALGLTTTIVGMCFNLIAGMTREIPVVGIVLFFLVLAAGHVMNFLISILGAFVHSARLIFVEFFGKFYQGDAAAFAPLGTWSGRIRVTDTRTVWVEKSKSPKSERSRKWKSF